MTEDHVTGKWSYSTDEETYHGLFDTKEIAAAELMAATNGEGGYVGQCRKPTPPWEIIDAARILEDVNELEDYGVEVAEGWDRSSREQMDELTALLQATAREWFERHDLMPRFWIVDAAERVELEEQGDG